MSEAPKRVAVHMFGWGRVSHDDGDFVVDREFYEQMRSSFDYITDRKHPPVLRQHEEDGFGWGKVEQITTGEEGTDLEIENDIDKPGIWAVVQLSDPAYRAYDDGQIVDWSPSFADEFVDRHTGKRLPKFLRELSFVSVGHLYNTDTPTPAYALSDSGFIDHHKCEDIEMKDGNEEKENETQNMDTDTAIETLSGQIGALVEQIEAMPERVAQAVASEMADQYGDDEMVENRTETAGEGEQEMSDEPDEQQALQDEINDLRARLEEQETERTKESARADIAEKDVDLSDDARADLVQLACDNREAFESTLTMLEQKESKIRELSDKGDSQTATTYRLGGEVGATGQTPDDPDGMSGLRQLADNIDPDGDTKFERRKNAAIILQKKGAVDWGDEESARAGNKILDEKFPRG